MGKLDANHINWEQIEFIWYEKDRIQVHSINFRRFSKEMFDAIPILDE